MSILGLKIDNVEVEASDGRHFERMNPISGEVASTVAAASVRTASPP